MALSERSPRLAIIIKVKPENTTNKKILINCLIDARWDKLECLFRFGTYFYGFVLCVYPKGEEPRRVTLFLRGSPTLASQGVITRPRLHRQFSPIGNACAAAVAYKIFKGLFASKFRSCIQIRRSHAKVIDNEALIEPIIEPLRMFTFGHESAHWAPSLPLDIHPVQFRKMNRPQKVLLSSTSLLPFIPSTA
ncbi:unnamed protein product [Dovyalis caffra]|uniref:Uncharacterized protein n=1 Tax=Dovyalis caffra TaxID=77055 RepID=A0AAV1SLX6_9ROSI|nr:unnamed protein product [Dovyalis caffra]